MRRGRAAPAMGDKARPAVAHTRRTGLPQTQGTGLEALVPLLPRSFFKVTP